MVCDHMSLAIICLLMICETYVHMSLVPLYVVFREMPVVSSAHFLIRLFVVFNVELYEFFMYFEYLLVIRGIICKYYLHLVG